MYILWRSFDIKVISVYYISLILFGVFFVLNLFLAVISNNYDSVSMKDSLDQKRKQ